MEHASQEFESGSIIKDTLVDKHPTEWRHALKLTNVLSLPNVVQYLTMPSFNVASLGQYIL